MQFLQIRGEFYGKRVGLTCILLWAHAVVSSPMSLITVSSTPPYIRRRRVACKVCLGSRRPSSTVRFLGLRYQCLSSHSTKEVISGTIFSLFSFSDHRLIVICFCSQMFAAKIQSNDLVTPCRQWSNYNLTQLQVKCVLLVLNVQLNSGV